MTTTDIQPVIASFATVRKIAKELGGIVTAQQVQDALPEAFRGQLSLDAIRSEFGALHDWGIGTKIGQNFRFDGDR